MKKLFIFLLVFFSAFVFGQEFQWAKQFGNTEDDRIIATDIDQVGNVYLLGESKSYTFDLNPNDGQEIINNDFVGISRNICFLVKLDSDGNYLWGKVFNNNIGLRKDSDRVYDIKIGTDNNIYALIDVYTYTGNQTIIDAQNVIVKLDMNGNELFVKSIKNLQPIYSSNFIKVSSFDLDTLNNIYLGGYFFGQRIVLDESNPQFDLTTSSGSGIFSIKIDNNGQYLWKMTPPIQTYQLVKLKIRPDGNLNFVYNSTYPNLISRLLNVETTNGTIIWEKVFDNSFQSETFDVSNNGNIILSCRNSSHFLNPVIDVDPSSNVHNTNAPVFILCLDTNGGFLDVKEYFEEIRLDVIKTDSNSNIYVSGSFSDINNLTFDADPSSNIFNLTSHYSQFGEGFYIKFNSSFIFEDAIMLGQADMPPTPYDNIHILRFTDINFQNDNVFFTGFFAGYGDLDPSTETVGFDTLHGSININNDGFILKLGTCDTRMPYGDSDQFFCTNQNPTIANLSPNTNSIKWYDSLTSTIQLDTNSSLIDGQTYYAARHPGNCPESINRLAVTAHINQTLQPSTTSNQFFCENENATISNLAATGVNLNWYITNVGGSPIVSNSILQNNTTYYVSQTINNCESDRVAVNVTIQPNPIPTLTSPQQFCIQQNATINNIAITGTNILWYDAPTNGNIIINTTPLVHGTTYYATQTINGCESSRVPVTVAIQNTSAPTGNPTQSFCSTENATLNNISIQGANIVWYSNPIGNIVLPNTTILQNGVTYYASQTTNGCESPKRLAVTIQLVTTLNANNYHETICDDLNNGEETVNLSNYNSFLITSSGNIFKYYNSLIGAQNQSTTEEISNSNNYNLSLGSNTIYVRITSPNTCSQIVTLTLTVVTKPIIPINDIEPLCEGKEINLIAGNGYDSYTWSTGETSPQITINQPGNYSVAVTQNHGTTSCITTKNFIVIASNIATIQEVISSDWTTTENTITVLLNSNSTGNYEYSLNNIDFQDSNYFNGLNNGEHSIYIRDKNGCGTIFEKIYLLMYPKFFTPNGDGFNDFWKIKFSEKEPNLSVIIMDRFGKIITQLDAKSPGWNGTFNGKQLPATDYWFLVKRENGKEFKGHFSLKR